jgi:very-short-patch-repair endonuclease
MASVVATLEAAGGIASVDDFRMRGFGRGAVRAAFSAGQILRVRRGWYALAPTRPGAPSDARVRAARVGGLLGCIDGAAARGLWRPPDPSIHVSLFDHARHLKDPSDGRPITGSGDGVVVHWDAPSSLRYGDLVPVETCIVQILDCQPAEMAFAIIESALRIGRLDPTSIPDLCRQFPRHENLLRTVHSLADSGTESLFRYRMSLLGTTMQSQVSIDGVGTVDFVIGDRLVIEIDSETHHGERGKRVRDLTRDAILAGLGYIILRFDYWMVMEDWETVASTVFAVVARGDHLRPESR